MAFLSEYIDQRTPNSQADLLLQEIRFEYTDVRAVLELVQPNPWIRKRACFQRAICEQIVHILQKAGQSVGQSAGQSELGMQPPSTPRRYYASVGLRSPEAEQQQLLDWLMSIKQPSEEKVGGLPIQSMLALQSEKGAEKKVAAHSDRARLPKVREGVEKRSPLIKAEDWHSKACYSVRKR